MCHSCRLGFSRWSLLFSLLFFSTFLWFLSPRQTTQSRSQANSLLTACLKKKHDFTEFLGPCMKVDTNTPSFRSPCWVKSKLSKQIPTFDRRVCKSYIFTFQTSQKEPNRLDEICLVTKIDKDNTWPIIIKVSKNKHVFSCSAYFLFLVVFLHQLGGGRCERGGFAND